MKIKEDTREFLICTAKGLFVSAVLAAFVGLLIFFFKDLQDLNNNLQAGINQEKVMKQSIVSGVITDKRIENGRVISNGSGGVGVGTNGSVGYFIGSSQNKSYVPTTYRIYVSNDYEYKGTTYTGKVFFEVSETVYNNYSIGEWFDSQNLKSE